MKRKLVSDVRMSRQGFLIRFTLTRIRMPLFTSMQIQTSILMRIQIQFLIKMIRICDHCQKTLSASITSVWPYMGPFWASKAPVNFDLNADPEPAFYSSGNP